MTRPLITAAQLRLFSPRCDWMKIAPLLDRAAVENDITTPRRLRHWLATGHHESLGFTRLEESLSYSAERLCAVWPGRFPTLQAAAPFAHRPFGLAERVYGGRMGNARPGDGWRYRGRGFLMLTGADNYAAEGRALGLDLEASPDLAARPDIAARILGRWWRARGLNAVVDADPGEVALATVEASIAANEADDARQARRIVNGGTVGLEAVMKLTIKAGTIWRDA